MAGFCGALRSGLAVGDIVTPAEVVDETGTIWACTDTGTGRLLTSPRLIATPEEKLSLGERFTADVVDMESAAVAAVCRAQGVPFLAVRAVSDTVDTALSPELVRLLDGGNVSVLKACGALVRRPSLFGEFRRLARDTKHAARNLATALFGIVTPIAG